MTVGSEIRDGGVDDRRYRQGMVHMQAGFWPEAIACFEEVARDYPDNPAVRRALEEARFKASLEAAARVRPKRWIVPWRPILVRGLIVVALAFLAWQAVRLIRGPVTEALALARAEQQVTQKQDQCNSLFEARKWNEAKTCYEELLVLVPGEPEVQGRLIEIGEEQGIEDLYRQGLALQEVGDLDGALAKFTELQLFRQGYNDSLLRIAAIQRQQELDRIFAETEAHYAAGRELEAMAGYEQMQALDIGYRRDLVSARLYELYLRHGRGLIDQDPPVPDAVPQAIEFFTKALALQPRGQEAALEKDLATRYLEGQGQYQAGRWEQAISVLRTVYDQRPDYLHGAVVSMLYEAYIRSGDQYRDAAEPDCGLAYARYGAAAGLPVADTTVARARQDAVAYCVPPTSTPTVTPTPTPLPTATPWPTWTSIPPPPKPTPTPTPIPLRNFRGKIAYFSDDPEQPGLWIMDPNGTNRRYLGTSGAYKQEYNALREREEYSPDGFYRVIVDTIGGTPQIFIWRPADPTLGDIPNKQLTRLSRMSYDPVWSPDGGRVAFVSQDSGSDDVWVIDADGKNPRVLTRNKWEWDKHPSWSADSRRIAFWSNRYGLKQIFVMDADGRNVQVLSNSSSDEYDPVWIK